MESNGEFTMFPNVPAFNNDSNMLEVNSANNFDNFTLSHKDFAVDDIQAGHTHWSDPLDLIKLLTMTIGFVVNALTFATLYKNGDAFSPAILTLFRHQSIADALVCLVTALVILYPHMWATGIYYVDLVVCYFWHGNYAYCMVLNPSEWNLVFIAFERMLAVCMPFKHQFLTKRILYIMIFCCYLWFFLTYLPMALLQTVFENNKCHSLVYFKSNFDRMVMYYFGFYVFICNYALPVLLFIVAYGAVIYTLRKRGKSKEMVQSKVIEKASTELTKTAIIVTMIFMVAMAVAYWYYLLGNAGVIAFSLEGPVNHLGLWLITFNSSANPFVYALVMPAYRESIKRTFFGRCRSRA